LNAWSHFSETDHNKSLLGTHEMDGIFKVTGSNVKVNQGPS